MTEDDERSYLDQLGQRVRGLRAQRGMTRKMLAKDSSVSERYLAQLESGNGNVSILLLRQIAQAIGIGIDALVGEAPSRPVETRLLDQLLQRLSPSQFAEAHALLMRSFGLTGGDERNRHLALIGLRGAGKSTLGRMLAARSGIAFVELDKEIERRSGMPVAEIIALGGQAMLRRLEKSALEEVASTADRLVLAVGGGIVAEPATYDLLLSRCYTIWLTASPEEHMSRVMAQGDRRPMADNPEAMDDLRRILAERNALYAKADARVDTAGRSLEESLGALVAAVPEALKGELT
jgi:XRE family transcriptional regulator, aerobic/anaerobic benzoate catabolism transcriptional regulator